MQLVPVEAALLVQVPELQLSTVHSMLSSQSVALKHATQLLEVVSQRGVLPEQCVSFRQETHALLVLPPLQYPPVHIVPLLAAVLEHAPRVHASTVHSMLSSQ